MPNRPVRCVALLVVLVACDGDTTPTAVTPPTTMPACVQTVVYERPGRLPAHILVFAGFVTREAGRLDATVDWTLPETPVTVSIADHAPCRPEDPLERCGVLAGSFLGPKPRKVSVANAPPGNYWVYVHNRGSQDDSASMQVVLSSPSCPQ